MAKVIHATRFALRRAADHRQLRCDSRQPARVRAVRPQARCVYRRQRRPGGQVRKRQRRHHLSRRDRRAAADRAGQAAARAAVERDSARRLRQGRPRRCAGRGRHQQEPFADVRGGNLSRGPVLPSQHHSGDHSHPCANARTKSRCSIDFLTQEASARLNCTPIKLSDDLKTFLLGYEYPGNIRELRNIIFRLSCLADDVAQVEASARSRALRRVRQGVCRQAGGGGGRKLRRASRRRRRSRLRRRSNRWRKRPPTPKRRPPAKRRRKRKNRSAVDISGITLTEAKRLASDGRGAAVSRGRFARDRRQRDGSGAPHRHESRARCRPC